MIFSRQIFNVSITAWASRALQKPAVGGGGWHKAIKMEISQMKPSARWLSWRIEVVMKFFYDWKLLWTSR